MAAAMHPHTNPQSGMSLRDWFAGQALAGLIAHYGHLTNAQDAYGYADRMLAERAKAERSQP